MKSFLKRNICRAGLIMIGMCLVTLPVHVAASNRFSPEASYDAVDIDMQAPYSIGYSGGLDVVYANVSTAAQPTRAFLHEQITNDMSTMDVQLFNYNGRRSATLFQSTSGGWPQVVKHIGDDIWFSYTGGAGSGYYSIPWDETLATYPALAATAEVISEYNWEVEQAPDGSIFVCGATSMSGGQSIGYVDQSHGNTVITVINIGGNSSGFAIDANGNIWSGEYILGYNPGMHIEPCRLGMWSQADINTAITSGTPLEWSDATVVMSLGTTDITGTTTNWGPNDIEMDSEGNIYMSMNTYDAWGYLYTYGRAVMIAPDGGGGYTLTQLGTTIQRTGNNEWDWARGLAFDGTASVNDGGYTDPTQGGPTANILYLDMDMGTFSNDIDHVVAITLNADYDNDGIPDAVDNAPETDNAGQEDADGDGYGNMADADFNNDNSVNYTDFNLFSAAMQDPDPDPQFDMDSDGYVNYTDYNLLGQRYGTTGPWY
jgi:hypothetical protein